MSRCFWASIVSIGVGGVFALNSVGARADTIAHYRFETGPAGAVATSIVDSSGHSLNGTILAGAPTYSSAIPVSQVPLTGQADTLSMQFGVSAAASFSYAFPFQTLTNATFELWVKPTQAPTAFDQDFIWGTTSGGDLNRFQMYFVQTTGQACLNYREPGGVLHGLGCSGSGTVPLNQWSYIAYVKRGNVYSIYVNGPGTSYLTRLTSQVTDSSPNLPTSTGWTINGRGTYNLTCCQYSGLMDEIRLSDQALAPSQFLVSPPVTVGGWTYLNNLPNYVLAYPQVLTDGSVFFRAVCTGGINFKLTPDITGSYLDGTWSQIASLPVINGTQYDPNNYASQVLPDGRFIVNGGESGDCTGNNPDTAMGAVYDPFTDTWMPVSPPAGWSQIGDAPSVVLANGTYMLGSCCSGQMALLNAQTLTWTPTGAGKFGSSGEEGYTLLPDGTVLTVDVGCSTTNSERYDPSTGTWSSAGTTLVALTDCSREVGSQVLRPDGSVFVPGGTTTGTARTAIFNASTGAWLVGPDLPSVCNPNGTSPCTSADAPSALLPNGNILFGAGPSNWQGSFPVSAHFFELSTSNVITQVSDPAHAADVFVGRFNLVVLPTGQVLSVNRLYSLTAQVYTPTGSYQPSWQPVVTSVPGCVSPNGTYVASGRQFNGLSEGASHGDDYQSSTNFPLVRIVNNSTGHVFYARTLNHSSRSVAPNAPGSTSFKVAANTEIGASKLYVVANGIPSTPLAVEVSNNCALTASHDFNGDGISDVLLENTGGGIAMLLMNANSMVGQALSVGATTNAWTIIGQRDINGDKKADILFRATDGSIAEWLLNGGSVTSASGLGNPTTAWNIVGTGDFNGDGIGDVLFRGGGTAVAIWYMNNTGGLGSAVGVGSLPNDWTVAGTGDFNGDGVWDILWFNNISSGVASWLMNANGTVKSAVAVGSLPAGWSMAGTGDFNGDGISDILLSAALADGSTTAAIWFMNSSGAIGSAAGVGTMPSGWTVAQTGDFNGDGTSDILWYNSTSGGMATWLLSSATIMSQVTIGSLPPSSWMLVTANSE